MNKSAELIDDDFEADNDYELEENEAGFEDDDSELEDQDGDSEDQVEDSDSEDESDDEVVVSIGDETPHHEEDDRQAPKWVKELRKSHREVQRENRDLKAKIESLTSAEKPKSVELGKKPTLEDCDYDASEYDSKLAQWYEKKIEFDAEQAKVKSEQKQAEQAWQDTLSDYSKKKSALKVRDFEDAEHYIQENFSTTQQGMIIQGADNAALVVYALGKNPKKAQELSSIKDPVKFAFAVAKLETQLKVTNRKAETKPEKTISGSGRISGSVDSTLERLRSEASKTGDFSKVMAYRKKIKAKK